MFRPWLNLANETIYTHHTSVMLLIHQRGTRQRGKAINKISNYQYTSIQCGEGWVGCHILHGTFHPDLRINACADLWKASLNFHLRFSSSGKNLKFENWVFSVFIWKFFDRTRLSMCFQWMSKAPESQFKLIWLTWEKLASYTLIYTV